MSLGRLQELIAVMTRPKRTDHLLMERRFPPGCTLRDKMLRNEVAVIHKQAEHCCGRQHTAKLAEKSM